MDANGPAPSRLRVALAVAAGVSGLAPPGTIIAVGAGTSVCLFAFVLTPPWLREVD